MSNKKLQSIIALCSMNFIVLASSATSPALASISVNFPDASSVAVASIATLSCLTAVPFAIISGLVVGKKISFRKMSILGLLISALGGFMPYFSSTIAEILVCRAILGIGTGLLGPIESTLTLSLFDDTDAAKQFGRNIMARNFGAVIFQLAGGFLCNYNWRMPFVSYLIILPVVIIVLLCLPEPDKIVKKNADVKQSKFSLREVLTPHVIFWSIVHALYMIVFYAYVTETSGIILNNGYGTAWTAAIVLSIFTASGVAGGYLFYPLSNKIKLKTFVVAFGLGAIGNFGLQFAGDIVSYSLFSIIFGLGYGIIAPAINYYLGIKLKPEFRASSYAVDNICCNFGSFCSPFIMTFIKSIFNHNNSDRFSFLVGTIFYVMVTVLFLTHKDRAESII